MPVHILIKNFIMFDSGVKIKIDCAYKHYIFEKLLK